MPDQTASQPRWTTTPEGTRATASATSTATSTATSGAALVVGPPSASPSSTAGVLATAAGRHVDGAVLVDALRKAADPQQGTARHRAVGPVDTVQLLSAEVGGGGQSAAGAAPGTSLSALAAPAGSGTSLLSTTAAAQRTTARAAGSPDTLLLLTTAGAALALAGTALETARRQRVRAAVARGHGRRALR